MVLDRSVRSSRLVVVLFTRYVDDTMFSVQLIVVFSM